MKKVCKKEKWEEMKNGGNDRTKLNNYNKTHSGVQCSYGRFGGFWGFHLQFLSQKTNWRSFSK
jgi:hypothetical protein